MKLIYLVLTFSVTLSFKAFADQYETDVLFRKGSWYVELTNNTNTGGMWCSAETENGNDQTFSLTAYDNDSISLFVFDQSWEIEERDIEFQVDIDRSQWTVHGEGSGIGISSTMDDTDQSVRFLKQLMSGNRVTVKNARGDRIAVFSLNGSYAAISNLMSCWGRITGPSDPF